VHLLRWIVKVVSECFIQTPKIAQGFEADGLERKSNTPAQ
jgi:hypothetical protein